MPRFTPRAFGATIAALSLGLLGSIVVATPAAAATITVTSNLDNGANTLREAVTTANNQGSNDGLDTIQLNFGAPTAIMLTTGVITVLEGVIIENLGASVTISTDTDADLFALVPGVGETERDFIFRGGALVGGVPNLTLDGNQASGIDGHGIQTSDSSPINNLTLERIEVREFSGDGESGAGVRVLNASGNITVTDVTFIDNESPSSGGGLAVTDSGNVTITGGLARGNDAGGVGRGGAIAVHSSGTVDVHGGWYEDNTADEGGALSVVESGELTIDQGAAFVDNHSAILGGAVLVNQLNTLRNDVTIESSVFRDNSSANGGAVMVNGAGAVTVTDATLFDDNDAEGGHGGGLAVNAAASVDLTDTQWTGNDALESNGGAVSIVGSGAVLVDLALFTQNRAQNGGAIAVRAPLDGGTITVANSMIADNTANSTTVPTAGLGGGLWIEENLSSPIDIIGNTFSANEAHGSITGLGGGVFIDHIGALTRVHGNTFTGNTLGINGEGGASIAVDTINGAAAELDIVNSTFDEAYEASMVYIQVVNSQGGLRVAHSTFVGETGIELVLEDGFDALLTHTAMETSGPPVLFPQGAELATSYSAFTQPLDTAEITNVAGNVFDLASLKLGPLQDNGNILPHTREPLTGSPLINTGNPAVTGQPLYDERGEGFARVVQVIDIGAVEVQHPVLAATGSTTPAPMALTAIVLLSAGLAAMVVLRGRKPKVR